MNDSTIEDLTEVGSIVQMHLSSPVAVTVRNVTVNRTTSNKNGRGISFFDFANGGGSTFTIEDSRFILTNTSNSDGNLTLVINFHIHLGAVFSLRNTQQVKPQNYLSAFTMRRCWVYGIQPSNNLIATKTFQSRGLVFFANQSSPLSVRVEHSAFECAALDPNNFTGPNLMSIYLNKTSDQNSGDDYGSLFYLTTLQTQVMSL